MVAAISTAINPKRALTPTPRRTPLLPSESDNALAPPRRPKAREVTSRYMSSSSSSSSSVSSPPRRCQSPLVVTRTLNSAKPKQTPTPTPTPFAKRSQSVERRRQATPRPNGTEAPAAQKMLFTSTRSLSVSFQGESFPIQVRTTKPPSSQSLRKSTPERRKVSTTPTPVRNGNSDHTENARSLDRHRWPAKSQPPRECADSAARKQTDAPASVARSLQNVMADFRGSHDATTQRSESYKTSGSEFQHEADPVASDTESVTSGSSSGEGIRGSRGLVVPARFWQEHHNNRLRRQTETPSSRNGVIGNKGTVNTPIPSSRLLVQKKTALDCPVSSPRGVLNSRALQGSPIRSAVRPASPSKLATTPSSVWSPSRGVSPSRAQNGVVGGVSSSRFGASEPSVLSFAVDVSRGKVAENRIFDAHLLRLFHNRLLQWRFVNARADAALSAQTLNAEKSLYDAWVAMSNLRESVRAKRAEFQLLKQQFKLISILKDQMVCLEDWATLDPVYSSSLSGATEALRASTLRLPVVGGAKTDLVNLKDAISSAMDVMQAMASSICLLSPKVGQLNSLVVEVANLTAKERVLLEECKDLLSVITTMQVRECSLRTHVAQLKCQP